MAPFSKVRFGKNYIRETSMHAYIWPTLDPIPSSLVQLHVGEDIIVTNNARVAYIVVGLNVNMTLILELNCEKNSLKFKIHFQ